MLSLPTTVGRCRPLWKKTLQYPQKRILLGIRLNSSSSEELDLTRFGDYEFVITSDPYRKGVSHITPASVPQHIARPEYAIDRSKNLWKSSALRSLRNKDSIIELGARFENRIRRAAWLAALTLEHIAPMVEVGVATAELDQAIHQFIISHQAYPSTLHYHGYPKSCCTSVNNVICHGIPDGRPLMDGDIVNVDVTVYLDGFHGDTSRTFLVGRVDQQGTDLVNYTKDAMMSAIQACGPGVPFREIGRTIESLALLHGLSVSSQFTGHGIGVLFHQKPDIKHYLNEDEQLMVPGHCFTIEPSLVQGNDPSGWILPDGWTCLTESGARSAQFEHTVLVTENGVDILTQSQGKKGYREV